MVENQKPVKVLYKGVEIGCYQIDILVNRSVINEVKSCENIIAAHKAQLINYLKATGLEIGLIIYFGKSKVEFERLAL